MDLFVPGNVNDDVIDDECKNNKWSSSSIILFFGDEMRLVIVVSMDIGTGMVDINVVLIFLMVVVGIMLRVCDSPHFDDDDDDDDDEVDVDLVVLL